ncbi:protein BIG GRAIN 1-like C [Neltuma alba]|uniref:protein BIG GRAIN 1-like C n=1 Tax=Neltuma alba TaxID=207710 RepID=UPI0010A4EE46|nr:protein BIG GRAIN 1-like C [Prosopis alba]XP_028793055.1 protein BIG GRAIN 1-like C [Prosopis alba]
MCTERSMRDPESFPQRRRTPSFSSSLLDAIYRSIDESKSSLGEDLELGVSKKSNFTYKQSVYMEKGGKVRMNLRRAVMMEDWMEKQSSMLFNSSSSSSECSSRGAAFSFSETEASFRKLRPKLRSERTQKHEKPKKVKQPISPGSRIASFLSSIFNSGNVKKAKMCYVGAVEDVGLERKSKSPCLSTSSASSFSCMRKTPKCQKPNNGSVKRCVRFYPVSVTLGENENSQPYHSDPNSVRKFSRNPSMKKLKSCSVVAKENRAEAKQANGELNFRGFYGRNNEHEVHEDDDALSCSSSDLFELDHLIGTARYREELPVYETTDLETNKAIANGLRV